MTRKKKTSTARDAAATYIPEKFHLDKRARTIAATAGDDDELLDTRELAAWFGVSEQWVEISRHRGFGPPYEKLGPRLIRYRRGKVRLWLDERAHQCTAEYTRPYAKAGA
jgi:predicted DNA-binding transcriptional regulator AlpA